MPADLPAPKSDIRILDLAEKMPKFAILKVEDEFDRLHKFN